MEKRMNWGLKNQTLRQDFLVLKNFFSILRPGGYVLFPFFSHGELMHGWRDVTDIRPYIFDMQAYCYTSSHVKIMAMKIAKHIPILLIRPKDMWSVIYGKVFGNNDVSEYYKNARCDYYESDVDKTRLLVEDIFSFCHQRNLNVLFIKMPVLIDECQGRDLSTFFPKGNYWNLCMDNDFSDASLYERNGIVLNEKGRDLLLKKVNKVVNQI